MARSCSRTAHQSSCRNAPGRWIARQSGRAHPAWTAHGPGWRTGNAGPWQWRHLASPARGRRESTARCWCARHAVAFPGEHAAVFPNGHATVSPGGRAAASGGAAAFPSRCTMACSDPYATAYPGLYKVASASVRYSFFIKNLRPFARRRDAACANGGFARGARHRGASGLRVLWPDLLDNLAKTGVVVTGVVAGIRYPGPAAATDDAPGSPVAQSWCSDGVFTVVAPLVGGQQPLAIAKDRPVLGMRERPSRANLRISLAPLGRQLGQCDGTGDPVGGRGLAGLHRRHRQHEQQNTRNTPKTPAHPGGYSLEHQHTFQKPRVNPRFQAAV